jgi:hypothetical protein
LKIDVMYFDFAESREHHLACRAIRTIDCPNRVVPCVVGIRSEEYVNRSRARAHFFEEPLSAKARSFLDLVRSAAHTARVLIDHSSFGGGGKATRQALGVADKVSENMPATPSGQQRWLTKLVLRDGADCSEDSRVCLSAAGDV